MSKKDDEINRQLIFNSGGANPEDYLTPKQLQRYQDNPERFIDIDVDLAMSNRTHNLNTNKSMENYLKDLNKLENFRKQNLGSGLFGDPTKVHHSQIRRYNLDYVKTVKFNPKSGQFEPFDKRTNTFYNEKDATKFIVNNVKKNRKTRFLNETGTETPIADLNYLYAYNKLQRLKSDKETNPVWAIRNSFSPKVEGSDTTLYEQNWLQRIKDEEAKVLKLRAGTKYEREILKQLKEKRDAQ